MASASLFCLHNKPACTNEQLFLVFLLLLDFYSIRPANFIMLTLVYYRSYT